jgi:uncharacterized membrane protein YkoI
MRGMKLMACLLAGLLLLASMPAAQARRDRQTPRNESTQRDGLSLDEAVARVQRDTGGRVLSADARDGGYRIKVLLRDGSVRVVNVDAQSGATR